MGLPRVRPRVVRSVGVVLRGLVAVAAFGWLASAGLTIVRVSPEEAHHWVGPVMTLTVAVAITATVAAVVLHTIPPAVDAFWSGVRHGRRLAEMDAAPGRHLRPVR